MFQEQPADERLRDDCSRVQARAFSLLAPGTPWQQLRPLGLQQHPPCLLIALKSAISSTPWVLSHTLHLRRCLGITAGFRMMRRTVQIDQQQKNWCTTGAAMPIDGITSPRGECPDSVRLRMEMSPFLEARSLLQCFALSTGRHILWPHTSG